jgi:hypothetical protein
LFVIIVSTSFLSLHNAGYIMHSPGQACRYELL